ncbi:hypothetical protein MLD52_04080 [Puniceicoccaceae bacterium K14]|nr:hypothetical protein [Puniceicoccaceae bacterium K14]
MAKTSNSAASRDSLENRSLSLRDRLHIRTQQLAAIANRGESKITQRDYEQAKRELTGEVDLDRQNAKLDDETSLCRVQRPPMTKLLMKSNLNHL